MYILYTLLLPNLLSDDLVPPGPWPGGQLLGDVRNRAQGYEAKAMA
jgi:hypothetical protein